MHHHVPSTVGLTRSQRESTYKRLSLKRMATVAYIDRNTSCLPTALLLACSILLKRLLPHHPTRRPLSTLTRLPQAPARTDLSHLQEHTHRTGVARPSRRKSSNASSSIVLIQVLVKTTLGIISRPTMKEIVMSAACGMLVRPLSWFFTHPRISVTGNLSIRGTSPPIRAMHRKRSLILPAHYGMSTPLVSQFNHSNHFCSPVIQLLIRKASNAIKKQLNAKTIKLRGKSTDNHLHSQHPQCYGDPFMHWCLAFALWQCTRRGSMHWGYCRAVERVVQRMVSRRGCISGSFFKLWTLFTVLIHLRYELFSSAWKFCRASSPF